MARTGVAAEHESRSLVCPAFEDVRAFRFLANCMQIQAADEVENGVLVARVAKFDLEPIRLFQPLTFLSVKKTLN